MPSGAKKRKAARKKKEQETHLKESTENPQGTDEVKSQDEKDSDTGGSNSPVHPHDHRHQFIEGIEPEERGPAAITSLAAENNFTGGVVNGDYEEEMISKVGESYVNKNANIQNVESVKESNNGNGANSSLKQVDESLRSDKHLQEEASNSVSEAIQHDKSDTIEPLTHLPVQEATELGSRSSMAISSVEPIVSASDLSSEVTDNIPVEKPVIKPKKTEDNIYGNVKATASEMKQKPKGYDRELLPSPHVPITETSNGDENGKESGAPECSENLPLLPSAPQVVHRTSWLSCCGLFEVLSASDK